MTSITADKLNDLRARVLKHEADVKAGTADADSPPYTIEELRDALEAISINRDEVSLAAAPRKRAAAAKAIDLSELL